MNGEHRSLARRLLEPASVDAQAPAAKVITYALLILWALVVLVPLYWVLITSFKGPGEVDNGPHLMTLVGSRHPSLVVLTNELPGSPGADFLDDLLSAKRNGTAPPVVVLISTYEDVRRGLPGWEPRGADETRDGALWDLVTKMGKLFYRRSPVGVVVRRPTGAQAVIKTGRGLVTVEGEPGEILLHAFGRDAARVELRGQPADVDALAGSARGV